MRSPHRDEGGQAIVLIGIVLLGLLMAVGLALDTGQLYNGRRTAQEAADAGAYAGAIVIYQQGTTGQATSAARSDAWLNGYCQATSGLCASDTPSGTTVTVATPPTSGPFNGNTSCVQVTVATPVRTTLILQSGGLTTVTAHATACSVQYNSGYAIMALDQNCDAGTIKVQNNGTIAVHGGNININSCSATAGSNSGTVTLDAGYETDVVGNASGFPNTHSGSAVQPDPFAGAPKPSTNGLTTWGTPVCDTTGVNQPGIYTASAGSACNYAWAPGTYIFENAAFNLQGNSSTCTGAPVSTTANATVAAGSQTVTPTSMTNVTVGKTLVVDTSTSQEAVVPSAVTATTFTAIFGRSHTGTWTISGGCTSPATADGGTFFFFTTSTYPATGGTCASVALSGNNATYLSPPSSGTYHGMLMWIDASCGSTTGLTIGGNGGIYASGSIYVPKGTVTGNGNNAVIDVSQIIANAVNTQNANFTMNYTTGSAYQGTEPAIVD